MVCLEKLSKTTLQRLTIRVFIDVKCGKLLSKKDDVEF